MLRLCPEIVIDRYAAVTAIDSGVLRLEEFDLRPGWRTLHGIGYSPRIGSSGEVPHQRDGLEIVGYDEFYVFAKPREIGVRTQGNIFEKQFAPAPGRVVVFVSWPGFLLHNIDSVYDPFRKMFWQQMEMLHPESYISDGGQCLTFVSCRGDLVDQVEERLIEGLRL